MFWPPLVMLAIMAAIFAFAEWHPTYRVPPAENLKTVQGVLSQKLGNCGRGGGCMQYFVVEPDGGQLTFRCNFRLCVSSDIDAYFGKNVRATVDVKHPDRLVKLSGATDNRDIFSYADAEKVYSDNKVGTRWLNISLISLLLLLLTLPPKRLPRRVSRR